jgi:hypothetical protein
MLRNQERLVPLLGRKIPVAARLAGNPIIRPCMLPGSSGENINGPSLIRVPPWLPNPLGKYYLYFAHHKGEYIRMAYADALPGPWTVYEPGTLHMENTVCRDVDHPQWLRHRHIASPDVHVDERSQQVRMYFHGLAHADGSTTDKENYRQFSFVATSNDGLGFTALPERLGNPYFRVFEWNGFRYALAKPGIFYRSDDGLHGFVEGPRAFPETMRHCAVRIDGTSLQVFHSNIGDCPERILMSEVDLSRPWEEWAAGEPCTVLEPEMTWEGSEFPPLPSRKGRARGAARELRDPAIFEDDGRSWLLYAVAGESGIAVAELDWS